MTTKQLLEELRGISGAFDWRVTGQQKIQGILKGGSDARVFDPITAVAFLWNRQFFPEGHSSAAARSIGLSFLDSVELVAACGYGFAPGAGPGDLRRDILNAVFAVPESARVGIPIRIERTAITH